MNRRALLAALAAFGASIGSRHISAQPPSKVPTLGFLSSGKTPTAEFWNRMPFVRKLRELGWIEGKNLLVERRFDEGKAEHLPALAAELVRKRVDVIYARGPEAAVDAARATKSVPIVFWGVAFPVEQGLIKSYARPGGNVTGAAWYAGPEQILKLLEIARQVSASARRAAYFSFPMALRAVSGSYADEFDRRMKVAAEKLGFDFRAYPIHKLEDFEAAFKAILAFQPQALVTPTTWFTYLERERIVKFANDNRLIGLFDTQQFVDIGGLISYGPNRAYLDERAANHVDRILRGTRPSDLPVELPPTLELAVNLKTAKMIGVTLPPSLLARADQVIE